MAASQASLAITNSWSLLKFMSIKSMIPSNHLILCRPLLLPPSIFPSIRVFSNESVLHIRWPKYWSFSFSISPSNEYSGLISFRVDWSDLKALVLIISPAFIPLRVQDAQQGIPRLSTCGIYPAQALESRCFTWLVLGLFLFSSSWIGLRIMWFGQLLNLAQKWETALC